MQHWTDPYLSEWLDAVNDYPSQVMIQLAVQLCQHQEHRLTQFQGQLDGQLWQGKVVNPPEENLYSTT